MHKHTRLPLRHIPNQNRNLQDPVSLKRVLLTIVGAVIVVVCMVVMASSVCLTKWYRSKQQQARQTEAATASAIELEVPNVGGNEATVAARIGQPD